MATGFIFSKPATSPIARASLMLAACILAMAACAYAQNASTTTTVVPVTVPSFFGTFLTDAFSSQSQYTLNNPCNSNGNSQGGQCVFSITTWNGGNLLSASNLQTTGQITIAPIGLYASLQGLSGAEFHFVLTSFLCRP